ncbi:MAG: ABC transporter permease [Halobacteriaceae archaeon]
MSRLGRVRAETSAGWRAFVRRRTAVFFTFLFPALIILIFGALVQTQRTGGGLFAEPAGYYVPGYLAVVVLLTPLSRVGSTVARHRSDRRFEKLATTPLTRREWLAAQTAVNAAIIGLASVLLLGLLVLVTDAQVRPAPVVALFVVAGVVLFCGVGAAIGRLAGSQDGVIAVSNTVGFPLLFLSETFVPPAMLPDWFGPVVALSPLTYFARGVRAATYGDGAVWPNLAVVAGLAAVAFLLGAALLPWTE